MNVLNSGRNLPHAPDPAKSKIVSKNFRLGAGKLERPQSIGLSNIDRVTGIEESFGAMQRMMLALLFSLGLTACAQQSAMVAPSEDANESTVQSCRTAENLRHAGEYREATWEYARCNGTAGLSLQSKRKALEGAAICYAHLGEIVDSQRYHVASLKVAIGLRISAHVPIDQGINLVSVAKMFPPTTSSIRIFKYSPYGPAMRGALNQFLGNRERAIEDFSEALSRRSDYFETLYLRGLAYYQGENFDAALKDLDRAISYDRKDPQVYELRAMVYRDLGETEKAKADFKRSSELEASLVLN